MHKCTLRCYWDLWQLFITNRGPCCRDMSHMCRFSLSYLQCVFIVWVNVTINLCVMCIKCPEYRVLLPAEVSLWKPCRFFRDYLTCRFMHFEWRLSPQLWSLSLSRSPPLSASPLSCVLSLACSVSQPLSLYLRHETILTRPRLGSFFTPANGHRIHTSTLFLFTSAYTSWGGRYVKNT